MSIVNPRATKLAKESFSLKNSIWNGIVVDNEDPLHRSRVKVSIEGLTDQLDVDALPWYCGKYPFRCTGNAQLHVPLVGSHVLVEFVDNDIYNGMYSDTFVNLPSLA